jgi:hypothetical protein
MLLLDTFVVFIIMFLIHMVRPKTRQTMLPIHFLT